MQRLLPGTCGKVSIEKGQRDSVGVPIPVLLAQQKLVRAAKEPQSGCLLNLWISLIELVDSPIFFRSLRAVRKMQLKSVSCLGDRKQSS